MQQHEKDLGNINNLLTARESVVLQPDYGVEYRIIDRSGRSIQSGFSFIHFLSLWLEASDIFCCLCSSLHTCSGKQ